MEISEENINKVIAEYMEYTFKDNKFKTTVIEDRGGEDLVVFECWKPNYNYYPDIFTRSVDACLPVVEKLDKYAEITMGRYSDGKKGEYISVLLEVPNICDNKSFDYKGKTRAYALVKAMVAVIEEIK